MAIDILFFFATFSRIRKILYQRSDIIRVFDLDGICSNQVCRKVIIFNYQHCEYIILYPNWRNIKCMTFIKLINSSKSANIPTTALKTNQ